MQCQWLIFTTIKYKKGEHWFNDVTFVNEMRLIISPVGRSMEVKKIDRTFVQGKIILVRIINK